MADMHESLLPLEDLVGTWSGRGHGEYPTIDSFDYLETVTFTHVGKPFLAYTQKTRHADTGAPLHAEAGYLRLPGDDAAELVIAQPTGIVEVQHGTVARDGSVTTVQLASSTIGRTATAVQVAGVHRRFVLDTTDTPCLRITLAMAAVGEPMTHHLAATLTKH